MMAYSCADIALVAILVVFGPLPSFVVAELFVATLVFELMLDQVKRVLLRNIPID